MSPAFLFLIVAAALIATELLIMQFSVFWFLFFGIGALLTAVVCWLAPELSWTAAWGLFFLASLLTSGVLYPSLKRWQSKPSPMPGNDAIGQPTEVIKAITAKRGGKVVWSGTEWPAELASGEADMAAGDTAVIRELQGIRLIVGR